MKKRIRETTRKAAFPGCCAAYLLGVIVVAWACGCARRSTENIAFIPQTEGTLLWEAAHVGAEEAVRNKNASVYWNAPTREDDVEGQIAIVDRVANEDYRGLVLAPDQPLALMTPVRRALRRGMPIVVIGSPLAMPAGNNLFYILNDDEAGGRIAARRIGTMLHGAGTIAILGIDPDLAQVMIRTHSFESTLAQEFPAIRIVEKRLGSFNFSHEQQVAQETINSHPDLDAIVAMMGTTVEGTLSTIRSASARSHIRVVGFDLHNWQLFNGNPGLDCFIQEDTRAMGRKAVELILDRRSGVRVADETRIQPALVTRENIESADVQQLWSQDWTLGRFRWSRIQ
jgi:ribose transport system substrate-binding protein